MSVSGAVEALHVQDPRQLVTIPEVAERLGIPAASAYDLVRENRLPGIVRVGRRVRVRSDELERWIERGGDGPRPA
jgi:excisionase family DNA binding protein